MKGKAKFPKKIVTYSPYIRFPGAASGALRRSQRFSLTRAGSWIKDERC